MNERLPGVAARILLVTSLGLGMNGAIALPTPAQPSPNVQKPAKIPLPPVEHELIVTPVPPATVDASTTLPATTAESTLGDILTLPSAVPQPLPAPPSDRPEEPVPGDEGVPLPAPAVTTPPLSDPFGDQPEVYDANPETEFNQYRLSEGDSINIFVVGFEEFSTQGTLNLQGEILVPILGLRNLRGFTLAEVEAQLSQELGQQYLQEPPDVIVTLAGARPAFVTVTGEVVEPGFYELPPGSNPFDAVFRAGGSRQQADLRSVLVRRTLNDGTVIEQTLDLLTPLQTGTPLPALFLLTGDAIVIPRLPVEATDTYDRQLAARSNIAQGSITVRVLDHSGRGLGALQLPNGSTFVDALTQISPNPDDADLSNIALVRFDPEQGRPVTQDLNGRRALLGDSAQNVPLEDEDVIVIGRSLIARVSYALNVFTRPFRDVLGFLLFFRELGDSADSIFRP